MKIEVEGDYYILTPEREKDIFDLGMICSNLSRRFKNIVDKKVMICSVRHRVYSEDKESSDIQALVVPQDIFIDYLTVE